MLLKWRLAHFKGGTLESQPKGRGNGGGWLSVALKKRSIAFIIHTQRKRDKCANRETEENAPREKEDYSGGYKYEGNMVNHY